MASGVLLSAALGAVASCTGGGGGTTAAERALRESATSTATGIAFVCVDRATATSLPLGFPRGFPLPPDAVVIGSDVRGGGRVTVYAVTAGRVTETLSTLRTSLPTSGLQSAGARGDEHHAEADWSGQGFRGHWAMREIPACPDQTGITVVSRPDS